MPRKPRLLTEAGVYHIVTRGNNRQTLFRETTDYEFFLSLLLRVKEEHLFDIYHYCLMRNHVHLLMRFYDAESLRKVMQRVNLRYAKYYRKKYKYCGHVFQDRFKSFAIEKDAYLLECGRYIERNPLKARIVEVLIDYPWVSYGYYAYGRGNEWVSRNPLYEELGRNERQRQLKYREYLLVERPYEKLIEEGLVRT